MAEQIKIDYDTIYAKVAELQHFLDEDVQKDSGRKYGKVQESLDNMSGRTTEAMKETVLKTRQKTETMVTALQQILQFIQTSTKEYQRKENELAGQIKNEEA